MRAERVAFGHYAGKKQCPGDTGHARYAHLPVKEFGVNRQKVDGLAVRCRACRAEDARKRRKEQR